MFLQPGDSSILGSTNSFPISRPSKTFPIWGSNGGNGKNLYACFCHFLLFIWRIGWNNRFKSSGELFCIILVNEISILLCEGPKPKFPWFLDFWPLEPFIYGFYYTKYFKTYWKYMGSSLKNITLHIWTSKTLSILEKMGTEKGWRSV